MTLGGWSRWLCSQAVDRAPVNWHILKVTGQRTILRALCVEVAGHGGQCDADEGRRRAGIAQALGQVVALAGVEQVQGRRAQA